MKINNQICDFVWWSVSLADVAIMKWVIIQKLIIDFHGFIIQNLTIYPTIGKNPKSDS